LTEESLRMNTENIIKKEKELVHRLEKRIALERDKNIDRRLTTLKKSRNASRRRQTLQVENAERKN
jgi:hypothetical protein